MNIDLDKKHSKEELKKLLTEDYIEKDFLATTNKIEKVFANNVFDHGYIKQLEILSAKLIKLALINEKAYINARLQQLELVNKNALERK